MAGMDYDLPPPLADFSSLVEKIDQVSQLFKKVGAEAKVTEDAVTKVEEGASVSFNKVMAMARAGYMISATVMRSVGGTWGKFLSMFISAAISAVGVLYPLFTAKALASPAHAAQAAIGMVSLAMVVAQIANVQRESGQVNSMIRDANMVMHGIGMMIGAYYT